jgi:hypothetical protein
MKMVFRYFQEDDMPSIELLAGVSVESEEVAPGIVLDIDLSKLELSALPIVDLILHQEMAVPA